MEANRGEFKSRGHVAFQNKSQVGQHSNIKAGLVSLFPYMSFCTKGVEIKGKGTMQTYIWAGDLPPSGGLPTSSEADGSMHQQGFASLLPMYSSGKPALAMDAPSSAEANDGGVIHSADRSSFLADASALAADGICGNSASTLGSVHQATVFLPLAPDVMAPALHSIGTRASSKGMTAASAAHHQHRPVPRKRTDWSGSFASLSKGRGSGSSFAAAAAAVGSASVSSSAARSPTESLASGNNSSRGAVGLGTAGMAGAAAGDGSEFFGDGLLGSFGAAGGSGVRPRGSGGTRAAATAKSMDFPGIRRVCSGSFALRGSKPKAAPSPAVGSACLQEIESGRKRSQSRPPVRADSGLVAEGGGTSRLAHSSSFATIRADSMAGGGSGGGSSNGKWAGAKGKGDSGHGTPQLITAADVQALPIDGGRSEEGYSNGCRKGPSEDALTPGTTSISKLAKVGSFTMLTPLSASFMRALGAEEQQALLISGGSEDIAAALRSSQDIAAALRSSRASGGDLRSSDAAAATRPSSIGGGGGRGGVAVDRVEDGSCKCDGEVQEGKEGDAGLRRQSAGSRPLPTARPSSGYHHPHSGGSKAFQGAVVASPTASANNSRRLAGMRGAIGLPYQGLIPTILFQNITSSGSLMMTNIYCKQ